jgi:transposase
MSPESIEKSERSRRQRRKFTAEYRAEAVRLVLEERRSIAQVARDLNLTPSALSNWVARTDAGKGAAGALTTPEREELGGLRRENRQLRLERDILKKAAAFFAKETR